MTPTILILIVGFCTDIYGSDTKNKRNFRTASCTQKIEKCYERGERGKDPISQPLSFCMSKEAKK